MEGAPTINYYNIILQCVLARRKSKQEANIFTFSLPVLSIYSIDLFITMTTFDDKRNAEQVYSSGYSHHGMFTWYCDNQCVMGDYLT